MRKLEVSYSSATHSCVLWERRFCNFSVMATSFCVLTFLLPCQAQLPRALKESTTTRKLPWRTKSSVPRESPMIVVSILYSQHSAHLSTPLHQIREIGDVRWAHVGFDPSGGVVPRKFSATSMAGDLCRDLGENVRYHEALPIPRVEGGGRSGQRSGFKNDSRP